MSPSKYPPESYRTSEWRHEAQSEAVHAHSFPVLSKPPTSHVSMKPANPPVIKDLCRQDNKATR